MAITSYANNWILNNIRDQLILPLHKVWFKSNQYYKSYNTQWPQKSHGPIDHPMDQPTHKAAYKVYSATKKKG